MTDHSIETLPSNSNKTHTFILLTLYHLVGPIYTQRMEEGKWNDPVKNFAFFKKINYSLLVWTLYLYAHCSACLYFCTGKNSLLKFCSQFVMHWSAMNANLMKVTSSGINIWDIINMKIYNCKNKVYQALFGRTKSFEIQMFLRT